LAKETKLPAIPHSQDPAVKALKEALEVRLGRRGDKLDRAITIRDLYENGVINLRGMPTLTVGGGNFIQPAPIWDDTSQPPAPTNVSANGAFVGIVVAWDRPNRRDLTAEIYRNTVDDRATSVLTGTSAGHIYSDLVGHGQTYYYWVRYVSEAGVTGPYNGTAGTVGVTNIAISDIVDDLSDAIGQTHLSTALSTEIDAIAINGNSITAEVSDRIAAISGEAAARINAISALAASVADITGAEAYDSTATYATNDLVTYSSKLYKATQSSSGNVPTNTTYWTLVGNYSSIGSVVVANASAVSDLDTRVTAAEGVNTSQATSITSLNSSVTNTNTNVATNTSAISGLDTRVTSAEGSITSQSSDITALETNLTATDVDVAANASGLSSLATTVTTQGANISTNASDITALETTVNNPTTGVAASASGLNTLSTTVATQGNEITSQASDITTLNTTVGSNSASIQSHTGTINGLSAENYVKVDVNGNVAGYGIYGSSTYSEFAVNAGVFKISDGSSSVQPFSVITGAGLTVALSGTQYTNTTQAWQQANHPTGQWFAAGTYMDTAMIADASIDVAKIANLTTDFMQVTTLLTASQVDAITVTSEMIDAGGISADKINVDGNITFASSNSGLVFGKSSLGDTNEGAFYGRSVDAQGNQMTGFYLSSSTGGIYADTLGNLTLNNVKIFTGSPGAKVEYSNSGTYTQNISSLTEYLSLEIIGGGAGACTNGVPSVISGSGVGGAAGSDSWLKFYDDVDGTGSQLSTTITASGGAARSHSVRSNTWDGTGAAGVASSQPNSSGAGGTLYAGGYIPTGSQIPSAGTLGGGGGGGGANGYNGSPIAAVYGAAASGSVISQQIAIPTGTKSVKFFIGSGGAGGVPSGATITYANGVPIYGKYYSGSNSKYVTCGAPGGTGYVSIADPYSGGIEVDLVDLLSRVVALENA